jgi:uncharacterized membrane protein YphA (DoxX/SURF4 family)
MQSANVSQPGWSLWKKISFRFCFLFFTMYMVFSPNGIFLYSEDLFAEYLLPYYAFIPWIGNHLLHISYNIVPNPGGSGDTTFDFLFLGLLLLIALTGTAVWSFVDKKRNHYHKALGWLVIFLRYYISFILFVYGITKVFNLQFGPPSLYGLLESYGASSPMRLAWTFLGFSKAYYLLIGWSEILCGVLLLFRRTVRAGIIVSLFMTINIMAVNYCFDVCVKLFSTILALMVIFLLLRYRKDFANFFLVNRAVEPIDTTRPVFRKQWVNKWLSPTKYVFVLAVNIVNIFSVFHAINKYGLNAPNPPLWGVYDVEVFKKNSDTIAPLVTDTARWRKLIVSRAGFVTVKMMNDSLKSYVFRPDTTSNDISMYSPADTAHKSTLHYTLVGDNLLLYGKWLNDSLAVTLKKYDVANFLLINRGFRFISETPYNR